MLDNEILEIDILDEIEIEITISEEISTTFSSLNTAEITLFKGDTGEKGDKGNTGEKGEKGDTGEKGEVVISSLLENRATLDTEKALYVPDYMGDPLAYYILAKS